MNCLSTLYLNLNCQDLIQILKMGIRERRIQDGNEQLRADNKSYQYQYDALNRLKRVMKGPDLLHDYQYDAFGNRVKLFEPGKITSYVYNDLNQLISRSDSKGISYSYDYDDVGNLFQVKQNDEVIHKYAYDLSNRIKYAVNHVTHEINEYFYNGLGHRVRKVIHDDALEPLKRVDDVIDMTKPFHNLLQRTERAMIGDFPSEDQAIHSSFTWDFGVLTGQIGKEKYHYLHDELGSPIRLMNEHGRTAQAMGYDEFGNSLYKDWVEQPFSFTGYEKEDELLYAQARQYDPVIGRFVAEDLVKGFIEAPFTLNAYTYVWNDPLNLVDLDGLMPSSQDAAAMADFIYDRDPNNPIVAGGPNPSVVNGWELVDINRNTNNWFTRNLTVNGLVMGVFRYTHDNGIVEYALVNQGTSTWYNWIDNARQGTRIGFSHDTRDSVNFARQFVEARPGVEVTMIGHSKGGAEARLNAFATGTNAILFNPAASNRGTLRQNGMSMRDVRSYSGTMITYVIEGEVLNNLQGRHMEHIGILRWLLAPDEAMSSGERHGMAAVIEALDRRRRAIDPEGMCES